jgi:hypothetical protein
MARNLVFNPNAELGDKAPDLGFKSSLIRGEVLWLRMLLGLKGLAESSLEYCSELMAMEVQRFAQREFAVTTTIGYVNRQT